MLISDVAAISSSGSEGMVGGDGTNDTEAGEIVLVGPYGREVGLVVIGGGSHKGVEELDVRDGEGAERGIKDCGDSGEKN